jgi:poly(3-hydroxybutyrate) depolymerase
MLYVLHEMNYASLSLFNATADATRNIFSNPWIPASYTQLGRTIAASSELMERTTRKYNKPVFGISHTVIDGKKVFVKEKIIKKNAFCSLLQFERNTKITSPKILAIAPLSGHYATLLRQTIVSLLPLYDVCVTDWENVRDVPLSEGNFTLDDHIDLIIDYIKTMGHDTHILSVCQPGPSVLAAVARMAKNKEDIQASSMILIGAPIDTRANWTKVNELANEHSMDWFEKNLIYTVPMGYSGVGRLVYPGFIQLSGFMGMNLDRHLDAHWKMFNHLVEGDGNSAEEHRIFYDEYLSVMDLPSDFYLETIRSIFKDHDLAKGEMYSKGEKIDLSDIRDTALMTIEGEKDDITAPGQCKSAHALCSSIPESKKYHHLQIGAGHYGIFNGRRWRDEILPKIHDFIHTNRSKLS